MHVLSKYVFILRRSSRSVNRCFEKIQGCPLISQSGHIVLIDYRAALHLELVLIGVCPGFLGLMSLESSTMQKQKPLLVLRKTCFVQTESVTIIYKCNILRTNYNHIKKTHTHMQTTSKKHDKIKHHLKTTWKIIYENHIPFVIAWRFWGHRPSRTRWTKPSAEQRRRERRWKRHQKGFSVVWAAVWASFRCCFRCLYKSPFQKISLRSSAKNPKAF